MVHQIVVVFIRGVIVHQRWLLIRGSLIRRLLIRGSLIHQRGDCSLEGVIVPQRLVIHQDGRSLKG